MTKTEQAVQEKRTLFSKNVFNPLSNKTNILKSGAQNKKLGGLITKGIWRGLPLYSLTLEERATCPTTCAHFSDCYGNNMRYAHRFQSGGNLAASNGFPIQGSGISNDGPYRRPTR